MLSRLRLCLIVAVGLISLLSHSQSWAFGGFYRQAAGITQTDEQIVFRQNNNSISALVRVQYTGDAEEFGWVIPVPSLPDISIGSERLFDDLDDLTHPRFDLTRTGEECDSIEQFPDVFGNVTLDADEPFDVDFEQSADIGPFETTVVQSRDSATLLRYFETNRFVLNERSRELLDDYVAEGMFFVTLRLRAGQSSGDIQPILLRYQGTDPVVPLRLTSTTASNDLGIVIWVVGEARAIPDNYLHVTPNYTLLNWYNETRTRSSYEALITASMNDSGGLGFATDYAQPLAEPQLGSFDELDMLELGLDLLDQQDSDAEFLAQATRLGTSVAFFRVYRDLLPLALGQSSRSFGLVSFLEETYTAIELANARAGVRQALLEFEVEPLRNSVALVSGGQYLTRLYTTLSPEEMTLDPAVTFRADMANQPATREATLDARCEADGTAWTLQLGPGTRREGKRVIDAAIPIPNIDVPDQVKTQGPTFIDEKLSRTDATRVVRFKNFGTLTISRSGEANSVPDPLFDATASSLDLVGGQRVLIDAQSEQPLGPNESLATLNSAAFSAGARGGSGALGLVGVLFLFLGFVRQRQIG